MSEHHSITAADLSSDQRVAYDAVLAWLDSDSKLLTLGGYAGSGKSTIVSVLAADTKVSPIAFSAYTGKAASVLRKKLGMTGVDLAANYVGTIHGLIYATRTNERTGEVTGFRLREQLERPYKLIVVDEASMVDEDIFRDLESFDVPILAVGDHGQLPPVRGQMALMVNPELRLEKIHRQAEGNPIIRLSAIVRETGTIPRDFPESDAVRMLDREQGASLNTLIGERYMGASRARLSSLGAVCYTNATRTRLNAATRKALGYEGAPRAGEQVICLRNARGGEDGASVYNGMRGFVDSAPERMGHLVRAKLAFPDDDVQLDARMNAHQFGRAKTFASLDELRAAGTKVARWDEAGLFFDFGYALTTHKSQGSSFRDLLLVYERPGPVSDDDFRRWLYTSVTRASERLTIIR